MRPDRAVARVAFEALLRRKTTIPARLISTHIQQGRAEVHIDGVKVWPQVSLVTRGDPGALEPIEQALKRALEPHPQLDTIEAYRLSPGDLLVRRDLWDGDEERVVPVAEDRGRKSAGRLQGHFLYELARVFRPSLCLEVGTGYGVSGLYLLAGAESGRLLTIEGDPTTRRLALEAFERFGVADRVESVLGMFQDVLARVLDEVEGPLQFVFEDGSHYPENTLAVFDAVIDRLDRGGLLVFDDIYTREGNARAWRKIAADERLLATAEVSGRQGVCVKG